MITEKMRTALANEAETSNMSILDYINDTRQALRVSMLAPTEEEDDHQEDSQKKQQDEDSFMSLPELSIGTLEADLNTGLPQGSDNITHQGEGLPHAAAIGQSAGTEVITAQTGGNPG